MAGEARPSVKYAIRLVKLHQLELAGLRLIIVRAIDWEQGVIFYKPVWNGSEFVASTSLLPGGITRDTLAEWKSKTPPWS